MEQVHLADVLRKLAAPTLLLLVVLVVPKMRGLSYSKDLGLVLPRAIQVPPWLMAWGAWIVATEWFSARLGIAPPERWPPEPFLFLGIRFLGMVILAPIGEELTFRGLLYSRIAQTRLRQAGAILLPALFFAAVHVQYGVAQCALIFLDALVLGFSRMSTGSVVVPIVLHAVGNLYAFWQRLPS